MKCDSLYSRLADLKYDAECSIAKELRKNFNGSVDIDGKEVSLSTVNEVQCVVCNGMEINKLTAEECIDLLEKIELKTSFVCSLA